MNTLSDTHPQIEALLIEGYRRMSAEEKLQRVADLNRALEELAAARIRSVYGEDMSEHELHLRLASLRLDRETMIAVFDWDPEVEGY